MNESSIVRDVMLSLGRRTDMRVWRQNTGALIDSRGRLVRYGVIGGGDISGILLGGRRIEIECKSRDGRQSDYQRRFGEMITRFGGIYLVVRSASEAESAIEEMINGTRP